MNLPIARHGPDRGLIVFVTALIVFLTIVFIYALESGGKL